VLSAAPHITPGSYWVCKSIFCFDIAPTDIFCKVLACKEGKVHIIRKTEYGFKDLPPMSFDIEQFLELYMRLEA